MTIEQGASKARLLALGRKVNRERRLLGLPPLFLDAEFQEQPKTIRPKEETDGKHT